MMLNRVEKRGDMALDRGGMGGCERLVESGKKWGGGEVGVEGRKEGEQIKGLKGRSGSGRKQEGGASGLLPSGLGRGKNRV